MSPLDVKNPKIVKEEIQKLLESDDRIDEKLIPTVKGALVQAWTLEELNLLSSHYIIVNNVNLDFDPAFTDHSDGMKVEEAHVDHVVIGMTTVFAIQSTNLDDYETGFESIEQASKDAKALWFYLKNVMGIDVTVKELISNIKDDRWDVIRKPVERISDYVFKRDTYWGRVSEPNIDQNEILESMLTARTLSELS